MKRFIYCGFETESVISFCAKEKKLQSRKKKTKTIFFKFFKFYLLNSTFAYINSLKNDISFFDFFVCP
ncbi:MAG: hypothetical protein A2275_07080 [Bacteroidetes bacterium RIFOXYA12_FULL_35_11]|nr:MAG: hypothetical protein A2X01_17520 [Bacteroidetes bacterium GWF2_35_48]OFY74154.1 MAG: hypothetical protein A2275_07080 [Bacteroidetes bacterium RIFOXYA12_FULL_35_11]OFY94329.1 MAG: hypothetical protein A2491_00680 [Bacteroidetes bacterium RIFOXYC12_FULL_35_7]OFY97691.1 MAG: hypothetical protein A2309_03280 [Bacteroidetes bacterium RIFOXYB2_FULL_35_7]HBX49631.1 hypothetical protein [Bacteroidales bacterium]